MDAEFGSHVCRRAGNRWRSITSPLLTATLETRRTQPAANADNCGANFCRWIVARKLRDQEKLPRYFAKSRAGDRRTSLENATGTQHQLRKQALTVEGASADAVRSTLMGLEGVGVRIYWQKIADMLPDGLAFEGRYPHGPSDAVNAALSYEYGILYSHVRGVVMNAGLELFAGFLHVEGIGNPVAGS